MSQTVNVTTKKMRGWNARMAAIPEGSIVEPGEGIEINNGVIALSRIPGISGSYTNPNITVDETGRITSVESGPAGGFATEVLPDLAALSLYAGEAEGLIVLNAGDGRSAIYTRKEDGTGYDGPAWITGERGESGTNGTDGINGKDGLEGPRGPAGERGAEGAQGPRGVQGETGPKGADGAQGGDGPQGPEGPRGPMGSFLTPNAYGILDEDRVTFIRNQLGDYFFLVDPDGDIRANKLIPSGITGDMSLHLIGWNGTFFRDYGQLTGAQGPAGGQGPRGLQGERGPQGEAGPKGNDGERGADGPRGLQGLTGERGPAGADGVQGIRGLQGERGSQGLEGAVGPRGISGQNGANGATGPQGQTGAQGIQGERGVSGFRGGAMYTIPTSGASVILSSAFNPVNVPLLVYNVGGYNFRPSGTAANALVIPQGVSMIRLSMGISFGGGITTDSKFHFSVRKNGYFAFPGCPSIQGQHPYTSPRVSGTSAALSVVAGDIFTLVFASANTGSAVPIEHTYFSVEVLL